MTKQELNRDVKRLYKRWFSLYGVAKTTATEENTKREFKRLYHADSSFESLNRENILRMLKMNNSMRVIVLHQFGLMIDEKKL
tara:strand:- start:15633 stop:15881 length:249 start_codon:yes stop_codon:yes gene_type:complete